MVEIPVEENFEPNIKWNLPLQELFPFSMKNKSIGNNHIARVLNGKTVLEFHNNFIKYDDLSRKTKELQDMGFTPLWVIDRSNENPVYLYRKDNISILPIQKVHALSAYMYTECGLRYVAYDCGEFIRYVNIRLIDEKESKVELRGVSLLKPDFVRFIQQGILPESPECWEYVNSLEYSQVYTDLVSDAAKYQYRSNLITEKNKRSARNLVSMLGKYVVKDRNENFLDVIKRNNSWYTPYLDNARSAVKPSSFDKWISGSYDKLSIVQVDPSIVDSELHVRGYIK